MCHATNVTQRLPAWTGGKYASIALLHGGVRIAIDPRHRSRAHVGLDHFWPGAGCCARPYAQSSWAAKTGLRDLPRHGGLETASRKH